MRTPSFSSSLPSFIFSSLPFLLSILVHRLFWPTVFPSGTVVAHIPNLLEPSSDDIDTLLVLFDNWRGHQLDCLKSL
jgi:hypothetical protein